MNETRNDSFPARLDVRTKLMISVLCSISAIVLTGIDPLLVLVAASTVYALSTRNIRGALITYGVVLLMLASSALFIVIIAQFFPAFDNLEARRFIVPFLRMLLMINVMIALAMTSRIQSILTALKSLHLPGVLFIPATVMIRFIPSFIEDVRQLRQTLKIRGYPMTPAAFLRHPLRTIRLLFAPMVFRALRSADELAIAAELKGVDAGTRTTQYETPHLGLRDYLCMAATALFLGAAFWLQYRQGFRFGMH